LTVTLALTNGNATALTGGSFTDTPSKISASGGPVGGTEPPEFFACVRNGAELRRDRDPGQRQLHGDVQRYQHDGGHGAPTLLRNSAA
jgi:hypothetical protein